MATFQNAFPSLNSGNHTATSPVTPDYNCIAWAAGEDDRWWWPVPLGAGYWPAGVTRAETIEAFKEAFSALGYSICENGTLQAGFQKVVLYSLNNKPTHMARQLEDGTWTSKLGQSIDINHRSVDALDGPKYGSAAIFMMRPTVTR